MSQGIHFISSNIPGYGPAEGKCLLCSGVSGRAVTVSSYSSRGFRPFPQVNNLLVNNLVLVSKRTPSLVCSANSSGHRRNSDFSRQNKQDHGFSRSRNRQNNDRENFENHEDSELLSSKNGPVLSASSSPRFQATEPGPREREIVELFRKVQAQLRERAAVKEEKKAETSEGQGKESETVDSLLKLLRKHSVDQGNKRSSSSSSNNNNNNTVNNNNNNRSTDFLMEQHERNPPFDEESTSLFNSNSSAREEAQETNSKPFRRPVSNFRRKSPVPRVKYQPVYTAQDDISPASPIKSQGRRKIKVEPEPEPEPESESDSESESEELLDPELENFSVSSDVHDDEIFDEMPESEGSDIDEAYHDEVVQTGTSIEDIDFSSLTVIELKAIAKSSGLTGYSRLNKASLIELLSAGSV